ncbi:MAG: efflux RND transporter periplasmic adaptor subunit [Vicinamibacterales bacterium]
MSSKRTRQAVLTVVAAVIVIAAAGIAMKAVGGNAPDVATLSVTKGDFVDYIEIRGDIRPEKSILLSAPLQSGGDLLITKLIANGAVVKKGDVLVEFDATTLEQRLRERASDLKSADASITQTKAQFKITAEEDATALLKAQYDVQRAQLDLGKRDLISQIEYEEAKLAFADAETVLKQVEAKNNADVASLNADLADEGRKRDKAQFDVNRTSSSIAALRLRAPANGTVNILPNPRSGGPFSNGLDFREGDRAWAGANILELPDLSSIHLEARLDESDRGRLHVGQSASIRIEAVPGKDFHAEVDLISMLAKVDFSSGWPPVRNFDLGLVFKDRDPRIRPGMSAVARIAADRLPNVTLVPAEAIFQRDGRAVVYRLDGSKFDETPIQIIRRGREQAAIGTGVTPGDVLAARQPDPDLVRRSS